MYYREYNEVLGINIYEVDVRQYDPAIARWTVIDPVVHHSLSPYNTFDNNPIYWADPSGADGTTLMDLFYSAGSDRTTYTNIGGSAFKQTGYTSNDELMRLASEGKADLSTGGKKGYGSELAAVIGFAQDHGERSFTDNVEITTLIYKYIDSKGDDAWGYLEPLNGTPGMIFDSAIKNHFLPLIAEVEKEGGEIVADVHTHGTGAFNGWIEDNNKFSSGGKTREGNIAYYENYHAKGPNLLNRKIVGYLVSPHGFIFRYDPNEYYGKSTKKKHFGVERYPYEIPLDLNGEKIPRDPKINKAKPLPVTNYGYDINKKF